MKKTSAPTLLMIGWALVILALPFYVFSSGKPQPADFGLLALFVLPAIPFFFRQTFWVGEQTEPVRALAAFVVVVVVVNVIWSVLTSDSEFLMSTSYYIFNLFVLGAVIGWGERSGDGFVAGTGWFAAGSLALQFVLSLVLSEQMAANRLTLFFNNPNQLAYFCLGALTLVMLAASAVPMPRWLPLVAAGLAGVLIFRSYSRAALMGVAILLVVSLVRRPVVVISLVIAALAAASYFELQTEDPMLEARLAPVLEGDVGDYFEDRGVERIFDHPEYVLFGAGEGLHIRFHPLALELHSSLANVVFSYGIAAVLCMLWFAFSVTKTLPASVSSLLLPTALYGLFHNGLRFRIFWIVLGFAIVAGRAAARRKVAATAASPRARSPVRTVSDRHVIPIPH